MLPETINILLKVKDIMFFEQELKIFTANYSKSSGNARRVYRFAEYTDSLFDAAPIESMPSNVEKTFRWLFRNAIKIVTFLGSIEEKKRTGIKVNTNSTWLVLDPTDINSHSNQILLEIRKIGGEYPIQLTITKKFGVLDEENSRDENALFIDEFIKYCKQVWQGKLLEEETDTTKDITGILFLSADPVDAVHLRLDQEFREIQEELKKSKFRDYFRLELPQPSVRPRDISQALLDVQPTIVHFSGHGTSTGALFFEDEKGRSQPVQRDALAALFEQLAKQIKCVILNACYSETQAQVIAEYIEYVIGVEHTIGDNAAIDFSIGFYQALGAGNTIENAYKFGCIQIGLQDPKSQFHSNSNERAYKLTDDQIVLPNIPESLKPVLFKKGQRQY